MATIVEVLLGLPGFPLHKSVLIYLKEELPHKHPVEFILFQGTCPLSLVKQLSKNEHSPGQQAHTTKRKHHVAKDAVSGSVSCG